MGKGQYYILVHQACFSNAAVAEYDNLGTSLSDVYVIEWRVEKSQNRLP